MIICKVNSQSILLVFVKMIEKLETILNKKVKVGALFMDLSKVFDTLDRSLFLAKLNACSFV